jgi:hypothetical protein
MRARKRKAKVNAGQPPPPKARKIVGKKAMSVMINEPAPKSAICPDCSKLHSWRVYFASVHQVTFTVFLI